MDLNINEEQAMLADSIARFISNDYDFERRQSIVGGDKEASVRAWRSFAELGLTAVPFSEQDGGLGGGQIELMLTMEQIGRGLVVEPFLANIVLAGGVLRRAASVSQKEQWIAALIGGSQQWALAFAEPDARFDAGVIRTTAVQNGDQFRISGRKTLVLNGEDADYVIVPARTTNNSQDISLFAVPMDVPGIQRRPYQTVDGHRAADIAFDDVAVGTRQLIGELNRGLRALMETIDDATLAICAEAVGIMRIMHEKTVEFTKNRIQFGVPIGSFQALQHRMVETLMLCEQSYSLLLWTVLNSADDGAAKRRAISALKYQVGTAGVSVAREAVQIHGGMGVTWELDIGHYLKRMTAIDLLFGNADFHLDRFAGIDSRQE